MMRFSLLIVLTVALLSVAFRIHSHPTSSAGPSTRPHVGASTPSTPSTGSGSPATTPSTTSSSTAPHHSGGSGQAGTGQSGAGQSGTGAGTGNGAGGATASAPQLPVTGWDSAAKLGALALLLIGGGALTVRAATPRR